MIHLPPLIVDLGLILGAGAVVSLIFRKLRQPLVLGYIIAGLLVGPHFHLLPTVRDEASITIWAEIGVIFLLFGLGLEFSFKKLVKVGGSAVITTTTEVIVMMVTGYILGQAMGWSTMDSIFLGGILSVSSTTIIIRAFSELGLKSKKFAGLVFGVLIVEDLVAIVLLVLLSTLAVSRDFAGLDMVYAIVKLAFFLVLWFITGIYFLPTILRKATRFLDNEMLLIVSLALCLLMVYLATYVGFSPALGAFIMGSILAETVLSEKIEHVINSVRDLFAVVFFVSVGMLIDPDMLAAYAWPIAFITIATVLGKFISTGFGALLSGQTLKASVQTGMSLSQIGEFSFIIATLGVTLKVTSDFLYPVSIAVSAITTFFTPYLIKFSIPFYNWLAKRLPPKWITFIDNYSASTQKISGQSDLRKYVRAYIIQITAYSVIIVSLIFATSHYIIPAIGIKPSVMWLQFLAAVITLSVLSPFIWALTLGKIMPEAVRRLRTDPRYKAIIILMQLVRFLLAMVFIGYLIDSLFSKTAALLSLSFILVVFVFFRHKLGNWYGTIERRFIVNLNDREAALEKSSAQHLVPWDAHIADFMVPVNFAGIGKTLFDLKLREEAGVNLIMIKRGDLTIQVPDRMQRIYPGDHIYLIGTDDQLLNFEKYLFRDSGPSAAPQHEPDITLQTITLNQDSPLTGKSIKESAIREKTHGLIVGIERNGHRILNPESEEVLMDQDVLWVVGNPLRIKVLSQQNQKTETDR